MPVQVEKAIEDPHSWLPKELRLYSFPQNCKNVYLTVKLVEENNVIVVYWSKLSMTGAPHVSAWAHSIVVSNVATTDQRTGDFIARLGREGMLEPEQVHIIEFSLGAHAAGKAADVLKTELTPRVYRVTGWENAGLGYFRGIAARKLTPEDGKNVKVIHTNAGLLGTWEDIGERKYAALIN